MRIAIVEGRPVQNLESDFAAFLFRQVFMPNANDSLQDSKESQSAYSTMFSSLTSNSLAHYFSPMLLATVMGDSVLRSSEGANDTHTVRSAFKVLIQAALDDPMIQPFLSQKDITVMKELKNDIGRMRTDPRQDSQGDVERFLLTGKPSSYEPSEGIPKRLFFDCGYSIHGNGHAMYCELERVNC